MTHAHEGQVEQTQLKLPARKLGILVVTHIYDCDEYGNEHFHLISAREANKREKDQYRGHQH
jgi:uncharacterized DUF497 family protein